MFYINLKGVRVGIDGIELTPQYAREILDKAAKDTEWQNRTINKSTVKLYASEMEEGKWLPNCETIKFNPEGRLNDGYHRCHAVIESNTTITTLAAFGVPDEMVSTIDVGRKRTVEDILDFWMIKRMKGVVPVVKRRLNLDRHITWKDSSPAVMKKSEEAIALEYVRNKKFYDEAKELGDKYQKDSKGVISSTDAAGVYCHLVMTLGWGKELVDEFFTKLANTSWNDKSIFATTSKKLSENKRSNPIKTEQFILCWNSFVKGNKKKRYSELDWFVENGERKEVIDFGNCIGIGLTSDDLGITNVKENENEIAYAESAS
jgi:hypothetical protein